MRYRGIGISIVLTIITCGIYGLYWLICLNDDIADYTGSYGTTGGIVVVFTILTCGIYSIYWSYKMGEKLDIARAARGIPTGSLSILYLVLSIFGLSIVNWALMQSELNQASTGNAD